MEVRRLTPANAPGLDAGKSLCHSVHDQERSGELGPKPLGEILTVQNLATAPRCMAEAPGYAMQKALDKLDMTISDMNLIEINEAFAAVPLTSTKVLAQEDPQRWEHLKEKTNVNGGAIAVGHPVGASGARVVMTLMYELRRRGGGIGAAGICGGLAQADAAIIKVDTK